jgi:hypothetical protein
VAIPLDRCERCTARFADHGDEVWRADRDRVCRRCAVTAAKRDETVVLVECAVCLDVPLAPTDGPAGRLIPRLCGVCTPLPEGLDEA